MRGAKKTRRKNTGAMRDDVKPGMRKIIFWKRARRRETRHPLKNAHRREMRKHFRDARPALGGRTRKKVGGGRNEEEGGRKRGPILTPPTSKMFYLVVHVVVLRYREF